MNKEDEMLNGYMMGLDGLALPNSASVAFIHGWRNGRKDRGLMEIDESADVLRRRAMMIICGDDNE